MVHNGKSQGSNMTCVILDDGLVFFDCSLFTQIGMVFRKKMEEEYNRKTIALVLTHGHVDHFFGMNAFADVPIISSVKAKRMFTYQLGIDYEKYQTNFMSVFPLFDKAIASAELRMPSVWFDGELQLGSGDNRLILRDAGGHSECSIYGYFEKDKVLIAGDDIQVDYHLYFGDQTGNLNDWVKTLKVWEEMDLEKVCGGHGPVTDKNYISATRSFLEELQATLVKLKAKNAGIEEVLETVNAIEPYWPKNLEKPTWYDQSIRGVYGRM
jgi:glyoxylase-like metal-dependent hydrolase (beta-lactamase superfamily II)